MKDQGQAKGGGQGLLGEIVTGGPQAPGGDDDVGPVLGDVHGGAEPGGIIPHHSVVVDVDANGRETLGDHLGVGIGNIAQQQFCAHGNELSGIGHGETSFP